MKKYIPFLSSGWVIIGLLVLYILFQFLVLMPLSQQFKELTDQQQILDLNFYAFNKSVLSDLTLYGEIGREQYLSTMWADVIYPIIYGLLLTALLLSFMPNVHSENIYFQRLVRLPFLTVLVDYGENISFYYLIVNFESPPYYLDRLAAVLNTSKWILVILTLSLLLYVISRQIINHYKIGKLK